MTYNSIILFTSSLCKKKKSLPISVELWLQSKNNSHGFSYVLAAVVMPPCTRPAEKGIGNESEVFQSPATYPGPRGTLLYLHASLIAYLYMEF